MNADDLAMLRALTARAVDVVEALQALAAFPPAGDVADVRWQLEELRNAIGAAVRDVMQRETVSRGREEHTPRHRTPPRLSIKKPLLSTDVAPNVVVQRYGTDGRPLKREPEGPLELGGKWAQWRGQK